MKSRSNYGSGSYQKLPSGKVRLRIIIAMPDGSRARKTFTGKTQAECRKLWKNYEESLTQPQPQAVPTLKVWAEQWLATKEGRVVYGTYKNYAMYLERHIIPALGNVRIDHINTLMIEQFLQTKQQLSLSAQKAIRTELHMIFHSALVNDLIVKNPLDAIAPLRTPQEKTHFFGLPDIQQIIRHCNENSFGYFVVWLLATGCRYEELSALKWDDIDGNTLTIQRAYVKATDGGWEIRDRTKSGKPRTIALPPTLLQLIPQMPCTSEFIFPNKDGKPVSYNTFYKRYRRYLEECHVPYQSPHACRHTYATQLINQDVSLRTVQIALGHSSSTVTERYTHPDIRSQIAAVNKLPY